MKCGKLPGGPAAGVKRPWKSRPTTRPSRITLHILSDFRQRDWSGPEGESLQKALVHMTDNPDVKIRLFDTAHPSASREAGCAVPRQHRHPRSAARHARGRQGHAVNFTVTLANFSAREAQVNVAIYDDDTGDEIHQAKQVFNPPLPLKIPAGSLAAASFELRFNPQIKANELTSPTSRPSGERPTRQAG